MPVLIEAISVVVRKDALEARLPGGWDAFQQLVPNQTLCSDADIARVGFMSGDDSRDFILMLERMGLVYLVDGMATDLVVVDQVAGPMTNCAWLESGEAPMPGGSIRIARLWGSSNDEVDAPEGWEFEGSLSQKFMFVPNRSLKQELMFLRNENGADIFLERQSGKEVRVGRTGSRSGHSDE